MSNCLSLDKYALPGLVTLAGLAQCGHIAKSVGMARAQYKVEVPETQGPDGFNRVFRAQQNHLEFYPMGVGSLWVGAIFFHPVPSSLLYAGYLACRSRYFQGYAEQKEKRLTPFVWSLRFLKAMMLLAALGVGHKLLRRVSGVDIAEKMHSMNPHCNRFG